MTNDAWKWQFIILTILGAAILWPSNTKALDDFNLAKYGPDAIVNIGRTDVIVKVTPYKDMHDLNLAFRQISGNVDTKVAGYSFSHPSYDTCEVHIVMPKIWDDHEELTVLGHEVLHCLLATHIDEEGNDIADSKNILIKGTTENNALHEKGNKELEDLYAEDRRLELEWLREDYEDMGIVITGPQE